MKLMIAKFARGTALLCLTLLTGCIPTPFPYEKGPVTRREHPLPESATRGRLIFVAINLTQEPSRKLEVQLQREYTDKVRVSEELVATIAAACNPHDAALGVSAIGQVRRT
ncbi:MAG: hypothetical protein HY699_21400 [Deltaproteobacteria bacterium]|nr:hypothetical protein [Deltaproteobacteria bacterium]